jgi:uncharacterized protein (TIGR02285 family)
VDVKQVTILWIMAVLIVLLSVCTVIYGAECQQFVVHYDERVPYMQTKSSGIVGLTADPANVAFHQAGLDFVWKKTSPKRQMKILQDNNGCDCMVGWFKKPERDTFAKYSHAIYQDKPQIAIVRVDNDKLQNDMTLDDLLSQPKLKLLVKDGYSYGDFLDDKIAQHHPLVVKATGGNINMLKMIHKKYADYFFMAPEESQPLVVSSGLPIEDFKLLTFPDIPAGEKRYILCSRQVEDTIMNKLNTAIDAYMLKSEK